jgi:hypothetical protein
VIGRMRDEATAVIVRTQRFPAGEIRAQVTSPVDENKHKDSWHYDHELQAEERPKHGCNCSLPPVGPRGGRMNRLLVVCAVVVITAAALTAQNVQPPIRIVTSTILRLH